MSQPPELELSDENIQHPPKSFTQHDIQFWNDMITQHLQTVDLYLHQFNNNLKDTERQLLWDQLEEDGKTTRRSKLLSLLSLHLQDAKSDLLIASQSRQDGETSKEQYKRFQNMVRAHAKRRREIDQEMKRIDPKYWENGCYKEQLAAHDEEQVVKLQWNLARHQARQGESQFICGDEKCRTLWYKNDGLECPKCSLKWGTKPKPRTCRVSTCWTPSNNNTSCTVS